MFCPNCGIDEKQPNQFCRACGTNLLPVREVVEGPDGVTASAITAREEIGRAVAAKIRETQNVYDLKKVAEDVLPEIEKFLESPEEKRVRRIRVGVLIALIGLGASIGFFLGGIFADRDILQGIIPAIVTLFIGLSFVINGMYFTVTKKDLPDNTSDANRQRELDASTSGLKLPEPASLFSSVTENTTQHLKEKE
ncbi:MAG TPA: zinc ribbon domain-containing protein, partial [Pyrinomonadaceae bacterium]|nr:zinc ribbon domain-containing protein [Pyrinomonadaceae bacterium]